MAQKYCTYLQSPSIHSMVPTIPMMVNQYSQDSNRSYPDLSSTIPRMVTNNPQGDHLLSLRWSTNIHRMVTHKKYDGHPPYPGWSPLSLGRSPTILEFDFSAAQLVYDFTYYSFIPPLNYNILISFLLVYCALCKAGIIEC